jgi:hypothetical protein
MTAPLLSLSKIKKLGLSSMYSWKLVLRSWWWRKISLKDLTLHGESILCR